ncbi:MAG: adenylyltransferase/cytidyltransferase family protein [Erysipelotrichales bacterium]|nr:adenylyltransferase/cytidyltransferase family protein [Erysipelotrichales bacterium]MBQ4375017.1 adenylyltransferase/cytidyltransferase family protein [Erysipelotrichales bacterium]
MIKVITYGTYDLLHEGHIRLLKRAKALGDYLIVGVTSEDFDRSRGKINVKQSLAERIEGVRSTGLADEIIVEEYEGQKIDDIRRLGVDIFTVGSDWVGTFDYLKEYCQVIYLERTQGVSSTQIRAEKGRLRIGLLGDSTILDKFIRECKYVNGVELTGIANEDTDCLSDICKALPLVTKNYDEILDCSDAVYIISHPSRHYEDVKHALERGKHVICESPIALKRNQAEECFRLAKEKGLILLEGIKTAYSMAYGRLVLMAKTGKIGNIISIDATCTSLRDLRQFSEKELDREWNSITAWAPNGLLPVFQLLGTSYKDLRIVTRILDEERKLDAFTKIEFVYPNAVASVKVGTGAKSEGEMVISGTKGYIYVPAPWWKTDYFEIRYENSNDNKRYFYQLDGEGIRYEIVAFSRAVETGKNFAYISEEASEEIAEIMEKYHDGEGVLRI